MYPLDLVVGLIGVSESKIRKLEKAGILTPKRQGEKYYSFTDIYVLKIIAIAERQGISFKNIQYAYDCLKTLKSGRSLSSFTLYHDGKEILDFTDDIKIIASKYGQIIDGKLILPAIKQLAIGTELDSTRQKFENVELSLKRRREDLKKTGTVHSLAEIKHMLYG